MNLGISQRRPSMSQREIFNIKYDCDECKKITNQIPPCAGNLGDATVFYHLKCLKIKK